MNNTERQFLFDKTVEALHSLRTALGDAGGNAPAIIDQFMERPLRDFLAQVCVPNYIRFAYDPPAVPQKEPKQLVDWSNAPPWAKYLARDSDRAWFWYADLPRVNGPTWVSSARFLNASSLDNLDLLADTPWEQTLITRPSAREYG